VEKVLEAIKDDLMPVLIVNVVLLTYAALVLQDRQIPDHLSTLVVAVVAFYFGGKAVSQGTLNGEKKYTELTRISREGGSHDG
jgi:hypothetical protein